MKQPTNDAARSLGLHPANLLLHLAHMGAEFDDVWPEVEEHWIDNLRQQDWERFGRQAVTASQAAAAQPEPLGVSDSAARIIMKLAHKRSWASNTVSLDTLKNHWCRDTDVDAGIEELLGLDFLRAEGPRGPYSLNQSLSRQIEHIADVARKRSGTSS